MDDLIGRSAVLNELIEAKSQVSKVRTDYAEIITETLDIFANTINKQPAVDAVPVVRCKDCKNRFTTHCPMHHEEQTYNENDGYGWIERDHTSDDGFCDEGELAIDDNL